eukprot:364402_1
MTSLRYQLLREGINSGDSGLARDSFHVLRQILRRIDDAASGQMCDLSVEMPSTHKQSVRALGEYQIPFDTAQWQPQIAVLKRSVSRILNRTWRQQLSITGMDGMPTVADAGNVLRQYTKVKQSIRIPRDTSNRTSWSQTCQVGLINEDFK